jgi:membrane peptidoglycan carboxypeptidase
MGYEIGVTPMQTVAAIATMVNGGELVRPHVVKEVRDSRGNIVMRREREVVRRVLRPSTSAIMRRMMQDVVDNGTGKKAAVEGYTVGGKTGTTRKSHIHTHREYISSFAGVIPCDQPRVAIYVFVDSPQGAYYASTVAAPSFRAIAEASMLHLGVTPQRVVAPEVADEATPAPLALDDAVVVEPGAMPDLRGMTVAQARVEMARLAPESLRLLGSGRAVDQFPAPGAAIEPGAPMIVVFDPSGERRPNATSLLTAARTTTP